MIVTIIRRFSRHRLFWGRDRTASSPIRATQAEFSTLTCRASRRQSRRSALNPWLSPHLLARWSFSMPMGYGKLASPMSRSQADGRILCRKNGNVSRAPIEVWLYYYNKSGGMNRFMCGRVDFDELSGLGVQFELFAAGLDGYKPIAQPIHVSGRVAFACRTTTFPVATWPYASPAAPESCVSSLPRARWSWRWRGEGSD